MGHTPRGGSNAAATHRRSPIAYKTAARPISTSTVKAEHESSWVDATKSSSSLRVSAGSLARLRQMASLLAAAASGASEWHSLGRNPSARRSVFSGQMTPLLAFCCGHPGFRTKALAQTFPAVVSGSEGKVQIQDSVPLTEMNEEARVGRYVLFQEYNRFELADCRHLIITIEG